MAGHGGKREGAGRKPGSATQRTREIANAVAEGLTPLEFLTSIYRDENEDMARRVDAAKAAAPYCHPRLQPVDKDGDDTQKVKIQGALAWKPPQ